MQKILKIIFNLYSFQKSLINSIFVPFKNFIRKLNILIKTNAPLWVIWNFLYLPIIHKVKVNKDLNSKISNEFQEKIKNLNFDYDWFTNHIPTWLKAFESSKFNKESSLQCLEIGSWQGMSAFFTLNYFYNAKLSCVDIWKGSDEHQSTNKLNIVNSIEQVFDSNLILFKNRLSKFKLSSYEFFNNFYEPEKYNLIYIDGSHHSDDVIVDAFKAFEMLKVGGIMIFDDYFWNYYKEKICNPAGAINSFLRIKKHQLHIVCFDDQVVIRKLYRTVR